MRSSLKIYFLILIFFIFSTYNNQNKKENYSLFFPIKNIVIENNIATDLLELKSDLNFLFNTSLLYINKEKVLIATRKHEFISNVQLKKKYPNTLKFLLNEKIPVATQILGKKKFYITNQSEKINFLELKIYENLPSIFGNYKNFNIFYSELDKNGFKIKDIKAFYYFDAGRWDIILKNEKTIKFPEKNYPDLFPKINLMLNDSNFSKYEIFDFRIKDQLILK